MTYYEIETGQSYNMFLYDDRSRTVKEVKVKVTYKQEFYNSSIDSVSHFSKAVIDADLQRFMESETSHYPTEHWIVLENSKPVKSWSDILIFTKEEEAKAFASKQNEGRDNRLLRRKAQLEEELEAINQTLNK